MSALTPTVELGAQWPPMGIEPVNPFELPLLNTVILLSSGATITYAHHSLIKGERKGALYGSIFTVLLALIFTFFQGVEYSVSSFTISDGVFGTCFFFATGFHGLTFGALFIYIYNIFNTKPTTEMDSVSSNSDKLLITLPESNHSYFIDKQFIEWLVGFTDAEGNFHIKLTDLQDNTFKYVQFTYQIGLHEDEVEVLEYIMNTLKCGHITKSKGKVNYFVNDLNSLLNIIIPIFNYVNLNSSKYHHFVSFSKAVELKRDSKKLSETSKLEIIKLKKEMSDMSGKWIPSSINDKIIITKFWLAGFIDGEATFSTNKYIPRFKLENNIKELELYNKIREFLNTGKVLYTNSRLDKENSNPTVIFELNKIQELRDNLIPLMYHNDNVILKTLKHQDFLLWLKLVDIYYNGYHTISDGKFIFDAIKLHMNKYRLTTNSNLLKDKEFISMKEIDNLMSKLYLINSPYEIKNNYRYYRNTNNLVSDSTKIIVIKDNEKKMYNSMSECAKDINISRKYVKECLISGKSYKGYTFVLN